MLITIVRWLLFLPASFIGGFLVFIIYSLFGSRYIESGCIADFIQRLFGGALSGAAATYIAVYVAPCCVRNVTTGYLLLAIIAIVFTVHLLAEDSISYIIFYVAQNIGISYMAWLIYKGDVYFENKKS